MPQCEKTTRAGPALFTQPDIATGHCLDVNSALGSYSTSGSAPAALARTDCVWMLMNESHPFIQHNLTILPIQASLISFHRYLYLKYTHILIYCFVSRECFIKFHMLLDIFKITNQVSVLAMLNLMVVNIQF